MSPYDCMEAKNNHCFSATVHTGYEVSLSWEQGASSNNVSYARYCGYFGTVTSKDPVRQK